MISIYKTKTVTAARKRNEETKKQNIKTTFAMHTSAKIKATGSDLSPHGTGELVVLRQHGWVVALVRTSSMSYHDSPRTHA